VADEDIIVTVYVLTLIFNEMEPGGLENSHYVLITLWLWLKRFLNITSYQ